ncbi:sensor histidine kinase [Hymenobacter weizhouensis]|uniref:sensor histidine kinase n=1 Tax=Hymenobacter sp. YIM 151500-1 TaxID=2987689 RepID=UPI002225ECCC|nr:HAMP domain-containing sensor histidine kinase [Hymenobacter sp. YIM 151500-1]UYZ62054.1 HAMP domain-containing histidine kinase [Hymenobacter sp. YIM 151500-1]
MNSATIRTVIVLGVVSVLGIVTMQMYWVRKAFDNEERQFNQSLCIALKNVAARLATYNGVALPAQSPVSQLSSNYYVVNVNDRIDAGVLEHYLRQEFNALNLRMDYEYAIYDCTTDRMVYGSYVSARAPRPAAPVAALPKYHRYTYYFGLHLPARTSYLVSRLDIWMLMSVILLVVTGFFGYALFVILRQKQLSEVQRDFINSMTHEFKTPIATIGLAADVLAAPDAAQHPQRLRSYAGIIQEENRRLNQQVNKVLQLARGERAVLGLHPERLDLHALIEQVVRNFPAPARIETELAARPAHVHADPTHLANLLFNLLDNAVKYAAAAPLVVRLGTRTHGRQLHLTVADNGVGIARPYQRRVFEKFFRVPAPAARAAAPAGFGLGLYYVRSVAQAHRWHLSLNSAPGQGSTFTLVMPGEPAYA